MRTRKRVLTEHELEIMHIVWRSPNVTVRDVYEVLLQKRKIAYTTVMTMMGILEQKGYLKKKQGEKAYLYRSAQPMRRVLSSMVNDFVDRVFKGSAKPLLLHLVENDHVGEEELSDVARLMKERRGDS